MSKNRWVAALLGVAVTGLVFMLALPMPVGSTARIIADGLLIAVVLLLLLHFRMDKAAMRELQEARGRLENSVSGLEQQLQEAHGFNQGLLDGVPDPALIIDKDFRVTAINKAARQAMKGNDDGSAPLSCFHALHGREQPCDPGEQPCVLMSGVSCKHLRTVTDDDGQEHLVELRATPIFDESGKVAGAVEVVHQLNEQEKLALNLQRAKEAAQTAQVARTKFVATMSHEVRTPLNAVLGMTDLLRLTALTRKQKTYIQVMESSSNMLLSLMDNMIDFSSLSSGHLELKKETFHLTDLLERVLEIMGYQAYSKGIELAGAAEHDPDVQITGDFQRLRQIMINLVGNGIKFTDKGAVIVGVSLESADDGGMLLTVSVSDTGIGIEPDVAERVFTPFQSVADDFDNSTHGSGLGLAISKQIVDLMGGEIDFETVPGEGTNIWFTVPVSRVKEASRTAFEGRQALSNRRMLLVSEKPKLMESLSTFLEVWGVAYDVETHAARVAGRLRSAQDSGYPFDCVIVDLGDEEEGRLAVARAVREQGDLPLVLLTSIAQPLKVGEISAIGRIRCLNKPVLPSELRHNLCRIFEAGADSAAGEEEGTFKSLDILIAEDNPINRKLLTSMLQSLGFEVDAVSDGLAVLSALDERPYDLILMDCQMPGLDGDEAAAVIREGRADGGGQPVIVAVTADVSDNHREKCLAAGMDDFLTKPVRLDTLKSGLRRWSAMADSRRAQKVETADRDDDEDNFLDRFQGRAGVVDEKFLRDFIDLFLDDTSSRLDTMRSALQKEDLDTIRRECLALKGACLEMGIGRLGKCCDALGQASRDNRLDDLPTELQQLAAEFDRVRPIFEAERSRID